VCRRQASPSRCGDGGAVVDVARAAGGGGAFAASDGGQPPSAVGDRHHQSLGRVPGGGAPQLRHTRRRPPSPSSPLQEELDRRLLVQLRDGRKLVGTLRSFDQFANLVLEGASERIIAGSSFADVPLGAHVVRGENVVLLGRLDDGPAGDAPHGLTRAPAAQVKAAAATEREADRMARGVKARLDLEFLDM